MAPAGSRERSEALRVLALATGALPTGLIVFDESGRVLTVNLAFERLFGLRAGEVMGVHRRVVIERLAHTFVDALTASELCAAQSVGAIPNTGEIALSAPRARVVSWIAMEIDLAGGPVQLVSCFDVNVWNDGAPSAGD